MKKITNDTYRHKEGYTIKKHNFGYNIRDTFSQKIMGCVQTLKEVDKFIDKLMGGK